MSELLTHKLITLELALDLSNSIECDYENHSLTSNQEWMELIPLVHVKEQVMVSSDSLQMMDKLFGHEILKNSFLKNFSYLETIELLNQSILIHLSAGEHIYKHDQIASHGTRLLT